MIPRSCLFLFELSALLVVGGLFFLQAQFTQERYEKHLTSRQLTKTCDVNSSIPVSSRGFARVCCDIFPTVFGHHPNVPMEAGVVSDPTYFTKRAIKSGDVVYVVIPDFPKFVEIFAKLERTVRITLVTGCEDVGAPWEIFHPNRGNYHHPINMLSLWPTGQLMTMREFLGDERLLRWYTQNYDLVGNNSFISSDMDVVADKGMIEKVFPLPIGLDLHTLAEKDHSLSAEGIADSLCRQRKDIEDALSRSSPFLERKLSVYAKFDCKFPSSLMIVRTMTRGAICKLLESHDQNITSARNSDNQLIFSPPKEGRMSLRDAKIFFWRNVARVQFALAPPGVGVDTHRAWEILNLHTVPIVMSSPLDKLYKMFPVIIVKDWSAVFEEGSLHKYQSQIIARFGKDPFSKKVDDMLRADYWIQMIRNGSTVA